MNKQRLTALETKPEEEQEKQKLPGLIPCEEQVYTKRKGEEEQRTEVAADLHEMLNNKQLESCKKQAGPKKFDRQPLVHIKEYREVRGKIFWFKLMNGFIYQQRSDVPRWLEMESPEGVHENTGFLHL